MFFGANFGGLGRLNRNTSWLAVFVLLSLQVGASTAAARPARLVLALDGIAYRDLRALQAGVTYTNIWGKVCHRQAFSFAEGYFPVSRLVSTFPSTSDVAWTDIFGDRPLPGYQRTYFSEAANVEIANSGVATTVEHERQMDWQVQSGFLRFMSYIYSAHAFRFEVRGLIRNFWNAPGANAAFYAYIRSSDDAQHLNRDVFSMLCRLDEQLQDLRARYQAREGYDLQIVILSDHGHNHAGPGQRVKIKPFLENAGYRIVESITGPKDVVLPTAGIEDWVEIHNAPAETERLADRLARLKGVDVLAARLPDQTNRFLVLDARGGRAVIDWNPVKNTFRYSIETGDPLNYRPVVESLAQKNQLDAGGFAASDDWMNATMTNHYPLALERIARGLTRVTLNPATILISLDNHYVNAGWLVKAGSRLENYGSTHGALDDLNSDGIVLSNFKPTADTSSDRVAGQFDDFPGLRNYRAGESGAEWVTEPEQALTRIARDPLDRDCPQLPANDVFLRVWSPEFSSLATNAPLEVAIKKIPRFAGAQMERGNHAPADAPGLRLSLNLPAWISGQEAGERIYALPPGAILEPQTKYEILGWMKEPAKNSRLFEFDFYTNRRGHPAAF